MIQRWRSSAIALLLTLALALYVALNLRITTDITEFLPGGEDQRRAALARSIAASELSRSLLVSIEATSKEAAAEASRNFETKVRGDAVLMSKLAFIQGGPPTGTDQSLWELYQPRRLAFAAEGPEGAKQLVSDAGLDQVVSNLKQKLESPLSTLVSRVAPEDPLLSVPRLLESMAPTGSGLAVVDGRFVAAERYGMVVLGTKASAFDAGAQREILNPMNRMIQELSAADPTLKIEQAGFARFAVRAEETIQSDLQRISVLSILGMLGVCLTLFRSLRLVLLPWIPIGWGMLAGTAACLAIFGSVHGITLAIGSSLMGVCIDYITHFYVHHLLGPRGTKPQETMRRVWMGLLLGGLTTTTGFLLLAGSSFPGLRQIATFSSVGIFASLISTRFMIPELVPKDALPPALLVRLAAILNGSVLLLQRQRRRLFLLPFLALLLTGAGLFIAKWDDEMSQLSHFDPQLEAEDMRVRQRVAQVDQSRFIVASGPDEDSALRHNDALCIALQGAREAGELGGYQNVSPLLKSTEQQAAVAQTLRSANLRDRLGSRLELAGFNQELFEPFFTALDAPAPTPLDYATLSHSEVAPLVRQFRIQFDDHIGFVTFLRDVKKPEALAARLEAMDGIVFLDQSGLMKSATAQYNRRIAELLAAGLVAIFLLLLFRYRRVSVALATLLPAVLACGVTIFVLSLKGMRVDVLSLTGLLMVLSMGVDYSVFMAESAGLAGAEDEGGEMGATVLGVIVDWFTTVFGFGVLAFSHYPAMRTIGLVSGVGITAALILAPTTLALVGMPRSSRAKA